MKRLLALLCVSGLALMLAGCGGGGGGGGDNEIRYAITDKIDFFRNAVEAYHVQVMLAFLDENHFSLTINENGSSCDKTYDVLAGELAEDEERQLHWRDPVPDGHGYVLKMELGVFSFDNLSASGGIATVPFEIWEWAEDISPIVTDTGNMVCEIASIEGEWRCRRMTINFNPPKTRGILNARAGSFGFGQFDLGGI